MIDLRQYIAASTPAGWSTRPFWSLFRRVKQTGFPCEELLSVYRDHGVVPKSSRDDNFNREAEDLSGYQLVDTGFLVTNKMKAWQGSIAISRHRGIVSPAYYVYRPLGSECDQFLHYLLRSSPYVGLYARISKGVRVSQWDLEHEALRTIPVLLPDRPTQKRIADFLDREIERIGQLIHKKIRVLELLEEKRKVVTLACLSGGVRGFTWSSERQAMVLDLAQPTWTERRVKSVVSFMTSGSRGWSSFLGSTGELFVQSGNIGRHLEVLLDTAARVEPQTGAEAERTLVRSGDVLVCITGGRTGAVGFVDAVDERTYINQHVCLLRARQGVILPKLLAHILWSEIGQKQFEMAQYGVKQGLGFGQVEEIRLPVPPWDMQAELIAAIEAAMVKIDTTSSLIAKSIDRLSEFRSALVTAAVTGQIDVDLWRRRGVSDRQIEALEEARLS